MQIDNPTKPAEFLTNNEAAAFLRLSSRTLEKWRVIGGGPPFRKFRRRVLYAFADLEKWASCRSFDTTSSSRFHAYGNDLDPHDLGRRNPANTPPA